MNTTINALIVDDEAASRSLLSAMLKINFPTIKIVGMAADIVDARPYFNSHSIDLILLDIEMPHGSGFDLLKQVENYEFEVIFVTGFDQYAMDAIKVHAIDYLLKPIDEDEFIIAVNTAIKRLVAAQPNLQIQQLLQQLHPTPTQSISIHTRGKIIIIRIQELLYLQADGTATFYYLSSGKRILATKPLGKSIENLPMAKDVFSHGFYRCHSGYVVNLFYVKEFNKKEQCLLLKNGKEIPVSQSKKELLLKLIS